MTSTLLSRTRSTHGQDAVEASSSSPAWTTARRVRRRAARRPRARILRSRPRPAARALLDGGEGAAQRGLDESGLVAEDASATRRNGRTMATTPAAGRLPRTSASCSRSTRATPPRCSIQRPRSTTRADARSSRARCSSCAKELVCPGTSEGDRAARARRPCSSAATVSIFLWDESDGALRCRALTSADFEVEERLRELCVRPAEESERLAAVLRCPTATRSSSSVTPTMRSSPA